MGFNSGFKGLIKIRPVRAELYHADGQTDRHDEANISSSSSSSAYSGRISFDSCSLYPQNEIGPSVSSSVFLCVFVLLVYVVVLV